MDLLTSSFEGIRAGRSRLIWTGFVFLCILWQVSIQLVLGREAKIYKPGEQVDIVAGTLNSPRSLVKYYYHYHKLSHCANLEKRDLNGSFGAVMIGPRKTTTKYKAKFLEPIECEVLCGKIIIKKDSVSFISDLIDRDYTINYYIDDVPAVSRLEKGDVIGVPLGEAISKGTPMEHKVYYTHTTFKIKYKRAESKEGYEIVGLDVEPRSSAAKDSDECKSNRELQILNNDWENSVVDFYSIKWEEALTDTSEYKSIVPSIISLMKEGMLIVIFPIIALTIASVAFFKVYRAADEDLMTYRGISMEDGYQEEFGWKLLSGDVFRKPGNFKNLTTLVSSGLHIILAALVAIVTISLSIAKKVERERLWMYLLCVYLILSPISGAIVTWLHTSFSENILTRNIRKTALVAPTVFASSFLILSMLYIPVGMPYSFSSKVIGSFLITFSVNSLMTIIGVKLGSGLKRLEPRNKPMILPRQIPERSFVLKFMIAEVAIGIVQFLALCPFIIMAMRHIWIGDYYDFNLIAMTLAYTIFVGSSSALVTCLSYINFRAEDYRWAWKSFHVAIVTTVIYFIYSIYFYYSKLELEGAVSAFLYITSTIFLSAFIIVPCTASGYIASLIFASIIYGCVPDNYNTNY